MLGLRLGLGLSVTPRGGGTPTPTPATQNERFGALTGAGAGGVAVSGTSISSGDPSGHWQISGGYLTKSAAGATAGAAISTTSLILNNGDTINLAVDASSYDVRTQAEWDAVIVLATATLAGKTIYLRPSISITTGVDGTAARLRRATYTPGLTIQGRSSAEATMAIVDRFVLRGTRFVTFRYLKTQATTAKKFDIIAELANPAGDITIDSCIILGQTGDPNGNYTAGSGTGLNQYPNADMVTTTSSSGGQVGTLTFTNNTIKWCLRGFNLTLNNGVNCTVSGNFIDYYYDDGININYGGADVPVTVHDNVIGHPIGKGSDTGNPHVDAIRGTANTTAATDWTWSVQRNRIYHGNSRGDMQGILLSDFKSSGVDSGKFYIATIIGNAVAWETTQALNVENAKNCVVLNNTVVKENTDASGSTQIYIGSGSADSTTSGIHRLERNISEGYSIGGTPTLTDNITLGTGGATIPYLNVFDGPIENYDSLTALMAGLNRKTGGPADLGGAYDAGAIGSGAVTWATTVPGNNGMSHVS